VLSDRFKYSPANLFDAELRDEARETEAMLAQLGRERVVIRYTNRYGVTPRSLLRRNHKKLIVIDDRAAYIGGINFSEHNASWHDLKVPGNWEMAGGCCGLRRCSRVLYHGFELVASDALARAFYCSAMSRDNSCCRRRRRSSSAWFRYRARPCV
jgi:hypothetical protein